MCDILYAESIQSRLREIRKNLERARDDYEILGYARGFQSQEFVQRMAFIGSRGLVTDGKTVRGCLVIFESHGIIMGRILINTRSDPDLFLPYEFTMDDFDRQIRRWTATHHDSRWWDLIRPSYPSNAVWKPPAPIAAAKPGRMKTQFIEMFLELNPKFECPVCFEICTPKTLVVSECVHPICVDCMMKLDKCPVCRSTKMNTCM